MFLQRLSRLHLSGHPRVHRQSLLCQVGLGQGTFPLLNLVWLFWVLAVPWLVPLKAPALVFTALSLLAFLPLYGLAWCDDRARLPRYTAAIAALGLVSVPINSSWSYIVYASSLLMYFGSVRSALAWLAALLVAFAGVAWLSPYFIGPFPIVFGAATCAVVAFFNLAFRASARRDAVLRLTQDEVRRLAARAERERIGRDLHDLLGATLSTIAIKSELAGRLFERDPAAARRELDDIEDVARVALGQVRSAVAGIRAAVLAGELASARLLLESGGLSLHAELDPVPLSAAAESAFALGLREGVTNIQRHARASRVEVRLRREGDQALLTLQDDGRGIAGRRGHGLTGMEERLRALGGSLTIEALGAGAQGAGGTVLSLRLPLAPDPQPASVPGSPGLPGFRDELQPEPT